MGGLGRSSGSREELRRNQGGAKEELGGKQGGTREEGVFQSAACVRFLSSPPRAGRGRPGKDGRLTGLRREGSLGRHRPPRADVPPVVRNGDWKEKGGVCTLLAAATLP